MSDNELDTIRMYFDLDEAAAPDETADPAGEAPQTMDNTTEVYSGNCVVSNEPHIRDGSSQTKTTLYNVEDIIMISPQSTIFTLYV